MKTDKINGEIKVSRHGGSRPGAGRKPNYAKRLTKPVTAALILANRDEIQAWNELLDAERKSPVISGKEVIDWNVEPDFRIRIEALKYLTDRRDGKPKQQVDFNDISRALSGKTDAELLHYAETGVFPDGQGEPNEE
jgi:hypothetical protein